MYLKNVSYASMATLVDVGTDRFHDQTRAASVHIVWACTADQVTSGPVVLNKDRWFGLPPQPPTLLGGESSTPPLTLDV